jgi:hypothetical protein
MKSLSQRIAACIALSLAFVLPAKASTTSVDFTDLWFIPAESGWGLNLIQQSNVLFGTLFVYGADNTPRWYVASDLESTNGTSFSGTLFKTTGPFFGAPWTGNTTTPAGNMTLVFTSVNTATLTYTADGVTVTKNVVRQTWRSENLAGNYLGGLTANGTSCAAGNTAILMFGSMSVSQSGGGQTSMTINFTTNSNQAAVCTFNGNYAQSGRQGSISGNWSCTVNGTAANVGTFTMTELQASIRGFNGRFQGQDQFCGSYEGNVGVVRDTLQ